MKNESIQEKGKGGSDHVKLAHEALKKYIETDSVIDVPPWVSQELTDSKRACFVSIKIKGRLRGCIGTVSPARENLAKEIIHNSIAAGTCDPRFEPMEIDEVNKSDISVDVLSEPEKVDSPEMLDAKKYGVIVSKDMRRGLLLPDLEGIETPEDQITIALRKAGITNWEEYTLERFQVQRYD